MGILAAVLVFSIIFGSCKEKRRTITITGLPGEYTGRHHEVFIKVFSTLDNIVENFVASGSDNYEYDDDNNSVTFPLVDQKAKPWAGKGSYFVAFITYAYYGDGVSQERLDFYTDGKNFRELGISLKNMDADIEKNLPRFEFESVNVIIPYEKFITFDKDVFGQSTITVTNPESSDTLTVILCESIRDYRAGYCTAIGLGKENDAIYLADEDGEPWYGEGGAYYVIVQYDKRRSPLLFSNGRRFEEHGLRYDSSVDELDKNLPKFIMKQSDNQIPSDRLYNADALDITR